MNALIFLAHLIIVLSLILCALRLGKEALITCFTLEVVMANLFVTKQVTLFGLHVTATDIFIIASMLTLQLIQEHFGAKQAKQCVWIGFFGMAFFGIMAKIHLAYLPNQFDTTDPAFHIVLSQNTRILIASLVTFFVVGRCDVALFSFLRAKMPSTAFIFRSSWAMLPNQILDTILFSFLGLYGLVNSIFSVIIMSLLIKIVVIVSLAPLTLLAKRVRA